jgi:hypothetical protein
MQPARPVAMTVRSRSLQLARPGVARGLDPFAGNGNRLNPGLRIAGHRGVARAGNYGLLSAVLSSHRIVSRPQSWILRKQRLSLPSSEDLKTVPSSFSEVLLPLDTPRDDASQGEVEGSSFALQGRPLALLIHPSPHKQWTRH